MTARAGWQSIRQDVLDRIARRDFAPTDALPAETELARHYGASRATVNRALQSLAADGIVHRRRRAGTVVARLPVREARLRVPIVRHVVEETGARYAWRLSQRRVSRPPDAVRRTLHCEGPCLHLVGAHLADETPFLLEDRWVDLSTVPLIRAADMSAISPNEWLVRHVPVSKGGLTLFAASADEDEAAAFAVPVGTALLKGERMTFTGGRPVTFVRQTHRPGWQLEMEI